MLKGMEEMTRLRQIQDWSKLTENRETAPSSLFAGRFELWTRIDARRDTCTGRNARIQAMLHHRHAAARPKMRT